MYIKNGLRLICHNPFIYALSTIRIFSAPKPVSPVTISVITAISLVTRPSDFTTTFILSPLIMATHSSYPLAFIISSTFEDVYGYNGTKTTENTLFSSTLSDETKPVVIKRKCPKIAGVMIVCLKKMEKEEYVAIKKAASTALNISQSKIYIIGGA